MNEAASQDIYRKIVVLMLQSKRHLCRSSEKHEMTPAQGMLLILFEPGADMPMRRLSCLMGCDASNVTGLVERLDSQELIERTVDPDDGRVKLIRLSDKGVAQRDIILKQLQAAEDIDLKKLSAEEQATLARLITKITAKA